MSPGLQAVHKRSSPAFYIVDGMPALRPIKTSRQKPGSATATPRHPSQLSRRKRRRLLLIFQLLFVAATGFLVFREIDGIHPSLDSEQTSLSPRKRQLISAGEDAHGDLFGSRRFLPSNQQKESASRRDDLKDALIVSLDDPFKSIELFPDSSKTSRVFAHPSSNPTRTETKYLYRFTNVRVGEDGHIDVFVGSSASIAGGKPFDISGNENDAAVTPSTPSSVVLNTGENDGRVINVRYQLHDRDDAACKEEIEVPTMLFHRTEDSDVWDTWTRSLLPVFQTLRELGFLSLMEISESGEIAEVTGGLPWRGDCPKAVDVIHGYSKTAEGCTQRQEFTNNLVRECDRNQTWCSPGIWPASMAVGALPKVVLLYASESTIDHPWSSMFTAMSSSLRSWDSLRGTCLRNLVVGTSMTVSTKDRLPSGGEGGAPAEHLETTVSAMDIFSRFMTTVHHRLEKNHAVDFKSYGEWYRDRLRRGIGRGKSALKYIDKAFFKPVAVYEGTPSKTLIEDWDDLKTNHDFVFRLERTVRTENRSMSKVRKIAADAVHPSPMGPPRGYRGEEPLPVVTYITRFHNFSRAVLNERQILRYIGWNYEVNLRVTTLTEHIGASASLLRRTDVLIGTYGDDWFNAIFLKPGACTLQLFPYGLRRPTGPLLDGNEVTNLVHLRQGTHLNWVNPHAEFSFFRREDFQDDPEGFRTHPTSPSLGGPWSEPDFNDPHPAWLNANTYVDLNHVGPYIDEIMKQAGIKRIKVQPKYLWEWEPTIDNVPCKSYPCEQKKGSGKGTSQQDHPVELEDEQSSAAIEVEEYADSIEAAVEIEDDVIGIDGEHRHNDDIYYSTVVNQADAWMDEDEGMVQNHDVDAYNKNPYDYV